MRSWALSSRRRLAAPAVWDGASRRYFAAVAGEGARVAVVAFTEESTRTLDELPAVATLSDGLFALFPATPAGAPAPALQPMETGSEGGVVTVSSAGAVRLLAGDGRERGVHAAPAAASWAAAAACSASAEPGEAAAQCVAVVSGARAASGAAHTLRLFAVADDSLHLTAAAQLQAPGGGAFSVVCVTSLGRGGAAVLWSDGTWAAYSVQGAVATLRHARRTACFAMGAGAAEAGEAAAAGGRKRRGGGAAPAVAAAGSSSLTRVGIASFGAYTLLLGAQSSGGEALAAVLDTRYGAVHCAEQLATGCAATREPDWRAQCVALQARDGAALVVAATPSLVLLLRAHAPPVTLAACAGCAASPATRRVLCGEELERLVAAPAGGAAAQPAWRAQPAAQPGAALARRLDVARVWDQGAMAASQAAEEAEVRRFLDAGQLPDAAVAAALQPLLRQPRGAGAPAAAAAAALQRCARDGLWAPLQALLEAGHAPAAHAAPALVEQLLAQRQHAPLRALLAHAPDVGAAELAASLAAALGDGDGAGTQAQLAPLRAQALAAVEGAERAAREGLSDGPARLAVARLLVAAVEEFPPAQAVLLHAVLAARRDDGAAAAACASLSLEQALALLQHLNRWARLYRGPLSAQPGGVVVGVAGVPSLAQVVSWASLALDAHWARLVLHDGAAQLAKQLAKAVKTHVVATAAMTSLEGVVQHLAAGKPLPAPPGTVSSLYSVERLVI